MDEFELIKRYFVWPDEARDVIAGIGDDGAVMRPPPGKDLVAVVDTLVEGVHFSMSASDIAAESIGHRAVAVNLSDIAAMGAEPRWMTLALTLKEADEGWLNFFAIGLHNLAAKHGVQLVGGDTTSGDQIVVSVQVTGIVDPDRSVYRSGARAGDTIYVSGEVGDAAAGLDLLQNPPPEHLGPHGYLQDRFEFPEPRIELGRSLADIATAAIDLSDGLYTDLEKLLIASEVGARIEIDNLPISAALKSCFDTQNQRRFALSGGDDYEILFTSSQKLPEEVGGVQVTPIGIVTSETGIVCLEQGAVVDYEDTGYRHFR